MRKKTFWSAFKATERWSDRRSMLKSVLWYQPVMRLDNRFQDARARLSGACNADTWTGIGTSGYAGGYSHWRCGKARGHKGFHRFESYIWSGKPGGLVAYDPISPYTDRPRILPFAKQAKGRRSIVTRRRARRIALLRELARGR